MSFVFYACSPNPVGPIGSSCNVSLSSLYPVVGRNPLFGGFVGPAIPPDVKVFAARVTGHALDEPVALVARVVRDELKDHASPCEMGRHSNSKARLYLNFQ